MEINCKTLKEWEDFGLLAELPEDRKEMVVFCYNIVMDWLTKDDSHEEEIEELLFPVFYRIAKIVDLTEAQVLETCKEFRQSWLDFDTSEWIGGDPEYYLVKSFAENKINQYKK